jgi:hypothetical protein
VGDEKTRPSALEGNRDIFQVGRVGAVRVRMLAKLFDCRRPASSPGLLVIRCPQNRVSSYLN